MLTTVTFPPDVRPLRASVPPATAIFLPREHGSWFLVLEPLALGLLIAPSRAGAALAIATMAAFFARRPLKPALAAVHSPRRREAREVVVMWSALVVAGMFEVMILGEVTALWPLVPAALLGAGFLAFDLGGDGREEAAEVAGSAAFAFLPAACAALAGRPVAFSLALAGLALARSVPAVLVVRACLRARKSGGRVGVAPWVATALASALIVFLVVLGQVPAIALVLGGLLLARSAWLLSRWCPVWPARRIGQFEATLGLLYVATLVSYWPSTG